MADRALYDIRVAGQSINDRIAQLLEDVTVTDKAGQTSDTAELVLDDTGGQLFMPSVGDTMDIALGRTSRGIADVFSGTIDEVRSLGSRGGGHQLRISAKGMDTKGKAKEPLDFHKDDASLTDFLQEAAGKAGLSFKALGAIGSIQRKYWAAATESFANLGQRIAQEVGGTFKIRGNMAIMTERNGGLSISGQGLTGVSAVWGDNLIAWDISPVLARPQFNQSIVRWYDQKKAKWMQEIRLFFNGDYGSTKIPVYHRYPKRKKGDLVVVDGAKLLSKSPAPKPPPTPLPEVFATPKATTIEPDTSTKTAWTREEFLEAMMPGAKTKLSEYVQQVLIRLGYVEVGIADGKYGGKTRGAISAFKLDYDVGGNPVEYDQQLMTGLQKARAEEWVRPISDERAGATVKTVQADVPKLVKETWWERIKGRFWLYVGGPATAAGSYAYENVDTVQDKITDNWDRLTEVIPAFVIFGAIGALIMLAAWYKLGRVNGVEEETVENKRSGKLA